VLVYYRADIIISLNVTRYDIAEKLLILFVKGQTDSNFFNSWWYNVERKEADKQLLLPGNPQGTFLVRESAGKIYQESKYGTQIKTET
jgi:hypothetical protein